MKKNHSAAILIVDKSGSMFALQHDTIGSINKFIEDQKNTPGTCEFAIVQFNSYVSELNIKDVKEYDHLTLKDYAPHGMTALNDAIGITIDKYGKFLSDRDESERPETVIICVITDGEENSSLEYQTLDALKGVVNHQKEKYNWNFIFLGADIDSFDSGGARGFCTNATSNYIKTTSGNIAAYNTASQVVSCLRGGASLDNINVSAVYASNLNNVTDAENPITVTA
jgi:hypothetical protein